MIAKHANGKWLTSEDRETNLALSETKCKCGQCSSNSIQQRIIDLFQTLRDKIGKPIIITSGFRCAVYNKAVGGRPKSQHLAGLALDMKIPAGFDVDTFAAELEAVGFDGIGKYLTFVHGDGRGSKARWDMRNV